MWAIAFLTWISRSVWHMIRWWSKKKHHNNTCLKDTGLYNQIFLSSIPTFDHEHNWEDLRIHALPLTRKGEVRFSIRLLLMPYCRSANATQSSIVYTILTPGTTATPRLSLDTESSYLSGIYYYQWKICILLTLTSLDVMYYSSAIAYKT